MEGIILGWNADKGEGVIKSESGDRYHFTTADWKSEQKPRQNSKVDFNIQADAAREIYALAGAGQLDDTLERAKAGLGQVSEKLSSNDLFRKLTEHGVHNVVATVMVFFALLFSFGNYKTTGYMSPIEVSVTDGFGGLIFVMAALGFISLAIFGIKPLVVRILGVLLAVILLLHLLSIPLLLLDTVDMLEFEDIVYYMFDRVQ